MELGTRKNLELLSLNEGSLHGSIPQSLGKLKRLQTLTQGLKILVLVVRFRPLAP